MTTLLFRTKLLCVGLGLLIAMVLTACSARAADFAPQFAHQPDGSWNVSGNGYTAVINVQGFLASFKVGDVETLGEPFAFPARGGQLKMDTSVVDGDTLKVHLVGGGQATIDYQFRQDGLTMTPTWNGGGSVDCRLTESRSLLGIELLNDKTPLNAEAMRFVDHGEERGVPAVQSSRNQMLRFHFPGFNVHFYVQAWGCPFNYESAGVVNGYSWARSIMSGGQAYPLVFTIEPGAAGQGLPAIPFVPRTEKVASLYYADESCDWDLDLGARKAYQYLLDAGVTTLNVDWRIRDVHEKDVATGTDTVALDPAADRTVKKVTLKPTETGYFNVLFTVSDPAKKMETSSFLARFTVIHKVPGMINRDDSLAGKGFSDYSIMGMIGIGAIRESHNMNEFFTNGDPSKPQPGGGSALPAGWLKVPDATPDVWMNTKSLDDLFNTASGQAARYHITYFFQGNSRPGYATPACYEAMAYALVSHYKDRNHVWEVENEPNFGYSPTDYVNKCLIPFAKGARRADPTCAIMGPDCVSLKQETEFMKTIYTMGANKYLDDISTHSYPGPGESWEQFGNTATIPQLRSMMVAHGDGAKPLWQTEQGYAWDLSPKAQTARYTVRQFLEGWRMGIVPDHQYYFYPQWHGFEDWYLQGSGEQGSENSWLPNGAALRFLAENTCGKKFVADIPSPYKGIILSRFSGADEDVVAAWTFDQPMTLRARVPGIKSVVDWMGNPTEQARGASQVFGLSGEPIYIHLAKGSAFQAIDAPLDDNLAAADAGAVASASSESPAHPASNANDGNWQLWEATGDLPGRTAWQSGQKDPSPDNPDWLQITFPVTRTVDRMIAICYLPAVSTSPRNFEFQVDADGQWKTVASGKDEFGWIFERQFEPVKTTKVRMLITGINDGWHGDRRWMSILMGPKATNYTDSKVLVSELEAYGPPVPARLRGFIEPPAAGASYAREILHVRIINQAGAEMKGSVTIRPPEGWTAVPSTLPVSLGSKEPSKALTVQLQAPATIPTGTMGVSLLLSDAAGHPIDAAGPTLDIPSPVQVTPQTPTTVDEKEQPLSVVVRNITDKPLSGVVTLSTGGQGTIAAPDQPFGPLAPNSDTTIQYTVAGLRLVGAPVKATYSVKASGRVTTVEQPFALRGWQLIGPYAWDGGKGFDAVYEPENGADSTRPYTVMGGKQAAWKLGVSDANGYINLLPYFDPNTNVVAYALVYVKSPDDRTATLSAGSDDGIKAWVNDKLVVSDNASRGAAPGQDEAPVSLKAGWNKVLLKITQGGGGWGFYFDLLDQKHQPMADLTYGARPE